MSKTKRINPFKKHFCFMCPVCSEDLVVEPGIPPSGAMDCYVGMTYCLECMTRLELNYEKSSNTVIATVKEQANAN